MTDEMLETAKIIANELARVQAENERLRAALTQVHEELKVGAYGHAEMYARAALEGKP
jgi:hypothetical protein